MSEVRRQRANAVGEAVLVEHACLELPASVAQSRLGAAQILRAEPCGSAVDPETEEWQPLSRRCQHGCPVLER